MLNTAEVEFRQGRIDAAGKTAAYSLASDARSAAYAEAEQRHRDRMAAIQQYWGKQLDARGNPDADHAQAFVADVADPDRLFASVAVEPPIGRVLTTAYNGIKRQIRVDANGRVAGYAEPVSGDGWSHRGTFTGDAEVFMAAKRAAVSPPEEPPPAPPIPPPPMIRAEPEPEPPPPGLLADIAAALAPAENTLR